MGISRGWWSFHWFARKIFCCTLWRRSMPWRGSCDDQLKPEKIWPQVCQHGMIEIAMMRQDVDFMCLCPDSHLHPNTVVHIYSATLKRMERPSVHWQNRFCLCASDGRICVQTEKWQTDLEAPIMEYALGLWYQNKHCKEFATNIKEAECTRGGWAGVIPSRQLEKHNCIR